MTMFITTVINKRVCTPCKLSTKYRVHKNVTKNDMSSHGGQKVKLVALAINAFLTY